MAKPHIVLLGAPGSGKGTAGELLEKSLNIPRLSTGDMIREEIKSGSDFGKQVKTMIETGALVPDEIIIHKVVELLKTTRFNGGVIFDGFPRTRGQAELMEKHKIAPDSVILFQVSDQTVIERICNRWVCPKDHSVYNVKTNPPKTPGLCDKDQTPLIQRNDDKEEVIKKRLEVYHAQTHDLIGYYTDRGLLLKVDASQSPQKIAKDIIAMLPR